MITIASNVSNVTMIDTLRALMKKGEPYTRIKIEKEEDDFPHNRDERERERNIYKIFLHK